MREIINKLIISNNTSDWLIAYYLIIKEYGDFYNYPREECQYLFIGENHHGKKTLRRALLVNYNTYETSIQIVDISKSIEL